MNAEFLQPESLAEAAALLAEHGYDAKLIAGGTAVVLMLSQRLIAPAVLVSLGRVTGQDFVRHDEDGLHLGALATLRDAEQSAEVATFCPALAYAFGVVGNVRIRHQATVGGNLAEADYASDPPAMLLALDARVKTTQREIPLSDLFLGFYTTVLEPDEIIGEISVPALPATARATYLKFTSRSSEDRPCVGVAAVADFDDDNRCRDLRIAVGAAVETPQRLAEVEAGARGEHLTDERIKDIAAEYARQLDPLSDARGSAWYRRQVVEVHVRRALEGLRDGNR